MVRELFDVPPERTVVLRLHVQPGAGRTSVLGIHGDALKVRVAAPPVDGRANSALVEFLATEFGLKPADVTLVSGASSRSKRFKLAGLEPEAADAAVERLLAGPGTGGQRRSGRR